MGQDAVGKMSLNLDKGNCIHAPSINDHTESPDNTFSSPAVHYTVRIFAMPDHVPSLDSHRLGQAGRTLHETIRLNIHSHHQHLVR